jgi:hypothetical protein
MQGRQDRKMCEDVVSLWEKEEGNATCRRAETLVLNSKHVFPDNVLCFGMPSIKEV